jgi:hypothetical protein
VCGEGAKRPLKVRIFLWHVFNDRLQSVEQLKKREWKGDINCVLCSIVEDVDHIMFRCVLSRYVWSKLREVFGWSHYPSFREDFVYHWMRMDSSKYCLGLGRCVGLCGK